MRATAELQSALVAEVKVNYLTLVAEVKVILNFEL